MTKNDDQNQKPGIAGLPKNWSIAVQLVGTFGLAVFLVLYYVLVMQPREAKRYEDLRQTVMSLSEIIVGEQSLVPSKEAEQLEGLYILAMSHEVAALITEALQREPTASQLAQQIEDLLIFETRWLQGLRRKDEGVLSAMLTHKIRNSGISEQIAQRAVTEWNEASLELVTGECRDALNFAIKRQAMAK